MNIKISDKKYQHAVNVWNKFETKTIKNYHNLYLKCDVLLLPDVFQNFRNNCLKNYRLYPSHYMTAPALNWDAMLNITKVKLELITGPDIYIFFQSTRGGLSYILHK